MGLATEAKSRPVVRWFYTTNCDAGAAKQGLEDFVEKCSGQKIEFGSVDVGERCRCGN
jgi:hypothetical protein